MAAVEKDLLFTPSCEIKDSMNQQNPTTFAVIYTTVVSKMQI